MENPCRRAVPADLDAIYGLEKAGFVPGIIEEKAVFAERIRVFPEGFLVLDGPAGLAGYFCAEIWSGPASPADGGPGAMVERFRLNHAIGDFLDRSGSLLYVASMTVAPSRRGTGLGRQLFRWGAGRLCRDFPALRRAVLIVNEQWSGARAIYAGEGFAETGRLPGFFRPDSGPAGDALVMERSLPLS
jgi:ribosomal-protein-alanine N-acetyltransferase